MPEWTKGLDWKSSDGGYFIRGFESHSFRQIFKEDKMAILIRDRDGEGHHGSRVEAIDPETGKVVGHEPMIGKCLLVGTVTAGTFSSRDWWCTSPITEIISETEEEMRFKTRNSTYTLKKGPSLTL